LYAPRAADSELERARTRARSARGPNGRARAGVPRAGRPGGLPSLRPPPHAS